MIDLCIWQAGLALYRPESKSVFCLIDWPINH